MRSIIKLLLLFILCTHVSYGQEKESLLWEINGPNLEKPSYLYGTIHLMDERVFSFDSIVYEKINACEALSGELLFDDNSMTIDMSSVFMKDTTLVDLFNSSSDYQKVKTYLKEKLGIFVMATDSMKPIYTMSLVAMMDTQMDKPEPLDVFLQRYAASKNKEILGIETMKEQQDALNSIPLTEQASLLLETVLMEDSLNSDTFTQTMIKTYLDQNLTQLDSLMDVGSSSQSFEQKVLLDRNVVMAERIEKFILEQPTFNTLGAGHLKGKNGVITLLRKKGYTLTPIAFSFNNND